MPANISSSRQAQTSLPAGTTRSLLPLTSAGEIRAALLARREIALLDVREEAVHAEGHPLFAANLPLSRIELDADTRLPRRGVPIAVFDDREESALLAAEHLIDLGYSNVSILEDGLRGWRNAGFEIFRDVNSPSKAFGELVESRCHTPSLSAQQVQHLLASGVDLFIADVRRYDEFHTMSIPGAVSAPGGELVYRLPSAALCPQTQVIVNCAGRTRSILGTQSLINAGLTNPVAALRDGTIGWKLAKQQLNHGATQVLAGPDAALHERISGSARRVADAAGVQRVSLREVDAWLAANERTIYRFDVRTPEEYAAGHMNGFHSAPGGQLVQETDMFAPVRGARIVLVDKDGVRANMTASWLAQMNWEVYVVDGLTDREYSQTQAPMPMAPVAVPEDAFLNATMLHARLASSSQQEMVILDFSRSRQYRAAHLPGARFALRSRLDEALDVTREARAYVVTAHDEPAARYAWCDLAAKTPKSVYLLAGGNAGWRSAGYELQDAAPCFASTPIDEYQRPYEGTRASTASMQAYLDWEHGLVKQLECDGTHGFWVLEFKQGVE